MNYSLIIKARLDGKSLGESHKAIEILAGIDGVVLEESSFKPVDQPTIIVAQRKTKTYSTDPRIVWKTGAKANGTAGGVRYIDIIATAVKLGKTKDQIVAGRWPKGSTEFILRNAILRKERIARTDK